MKASVVLARALARHCPNCGGHGIWDSYFRLRPHCPQCGLLFERGESGYVVGSYMLNMIVAELVPTALAILVVAFTWPNPPWQAVLYGGILLMIVLPFVFYPLFKDAVPRLRSALRPTGPG